MPGIDGWETIRRLRAAGLGDGAAGDRLGERLRPCARQRRRHRRGRLPRQAGAPGASCSTGWATVCRCAGSHGRPARRVRGRASRTRSAARRRAPAGPARPGRPRLHARHPAEARRDRGRRRRRRRVSSPGCARWRSASNSMPCSARWTGPRMNRRRLNTDGVADVVLIVDDVPDNLAVLHDALDESGYTVLVATSGEAALARAAQAPARHRAARRRDAGHRRLRGRAPAQGRPGHRRDPDHLHDRPDRDRTRGRRPSAPAWWTT